MVADMSMACAEPMSATPMVPAVVQELPMDSETSAEMTHTAA